MDSRDQVRDSYSKSGRQYDDVRIRNPRGVLLSEHDVGLFERICPRYEAGMRVAEVGAGTGRFTMPTLGMGFSLTATDINETMLEQLRLKLEEASLSDRCQVQIEDIFKLSFEDGRFDYVYCLHVIPRFNCLEDQEGALSELIRIVAPGGLLLFNFRNANSFYQLLNKGHAARALHIRRILESRGMRIIDRRCKHLINRKLLDRLPLWCGRIISRIDRLIEKFAPDLAWDVFVLARKQ